MTRTRDEILKVAKQAEGMPYGPTRVALMEESVRLADSLQDLDLAFSLRDRLMDSATFSARKDVALVAFTWCLAQHDRHPGRFNTHQVLWKYKWIINACNTFPQIPRDRVVALLADFESRCRAMGASLHALHKLRRSFFMHVGEREAARAAHAEFRRCRRDELSDCAACVANSDCCYYGYQRQWSRAVQAAAPVLAGRLTCRSEPHGILASLLLPKLRLGRIEEAEAHHRQGYRLVISGRQYLDNQGEHLRYLSMIGNLDRASVLVERHINDAVATILPLDRYSFLLAAALWAERMLREGKGTAKIRLPESAPPADARGARDIAACRDWFLGGAREVADQFDRRNGTDAFASAIDELPELLRPARARRKSE